MKHNTGAHHHAPSGTHTSLSAAAAAATSRGRPVTGATGGGFLSSSGASSSTPAAGAGPIIDARRSDEELKVGVPVVAVPRLDDLIIKALAEHYDGMMLVCLFVCLIDQR